MHNFNAGVAGKSSLVEGENGGEAMHLHGGHQPCIMRGFPRPRGDDPQFEKILRNDVKLAAPAWQSFKGARNRFVLGVPNL